MNKSDYLKWRKLLNLRTSAIQDAMCLDAESRGLRFMVDFGLSTPPHEIGMSEMLKSIRNAKAKLAAN